MTDYTLLREQIKADTGESIVKQVSEYDLAQEIIQELIDEAMTEAFAYFAWRRGHPCRALVTTKERELHLLDWWKKGLHK